VPIRSVATFSGAGELDTHKLLDAIKTYGALLIDGTTNLPFADEEISAISGFLGDENKWATRTFKPHRASGFDDIRNSVAPTAGIDC